MHTLNRQNGSELDSPENSKQIRVLLVEDDESYGCALESKFKALSGGEIELVRAASLDQAYPLIDQDRWDILLLDLNLPDSKGVSTCSAVQSRAPDLPILILTALEDEGAALEAVRQGAQDYLVKGHAEPRMLLRIIRYAIERNRIRRALREKEEFYRLISESMSDLIVVLDREGKRLYISPSYRQLFDHPEDLLGTDSFREIHPDDRERIQRVFEETVRTGIGQRAEYRFVLPDGSVRYVESLGNVVRNASGATDHVVVVSRDVTDRLASLDRLRRSEALYHSLVESLPQCIFRKDLQGRFTFANQRFCQSLGQPLEIILGKTDFDFYPAAMAEKFRRDDLHVIKTGSILETDEENQPAGGQRTDVHVVKIPKYDSQGQINGIQGIYWDVTQQKLADRNLRQTLADLKRSHEELNAAQLRLIQAAKLEMVGTIAAGIAHEVKNPLQIILTGLDYLSQICPRTNDHVRSVLDDMRSAIQRANAIVFGLLNFASSHQADMKDEDLNAVIEQSLWLINYQLTKYHVRVVRQLADLLPAALLDRTKMEQVFINLFLNAIQAMPAGGTLTVKTWGGPCKHLPGAERLSPLFQPNDPIIIAQVLDTGSGIPEDLLPRIFDPFFTTKPLGTGTGLGLAVARKIIELHGGCVWIKNVTPSGVLATVILRAHRNAADATNRFNLESSGFEMDPSKPLKQF